MKELLDKKNLDEKEAFEVCSYISEQIDLLNVANHKVDLPVPFSPSQVVTDEIVFFPGSFNPWHEGHTACLKGCEDKPIFIVPDHNPWKEVRKKNPWHEVVHIKENIKSISDKNITIYPGFLVEGKKNPTSSWLPHVNVEKKWLLMGDDLFLGLHKWFEVDKLLSSLHGLYVCPRGESKEELNKQKENFQKNFNLEIVFLDHHEFEDLSSTQLRNK